MTDTDDQSLGPDDLSDLAGRLWEERMAHYGYTDLDAIKLPIDHEAHGCVPWGYGWICEDPDTGKPTHPDETAGEEVAEWIGWLLGESSLSRR